VRLFQSVIEHVDCTVLEGVRSDERQAELCRQGKSKLDGVTKKSKHQVKADGYSHAVDVAFYPIDWNDRLRWIHFGGIVIGHAHRLGIKIRWGGDWDGDGDLSDQSFNDYPHFERAG
tara:strand:- start:30 stop:380 length:351 start_codon:yes stop_codon:yes gene_type:complete